MVNFQKRTFSDFLYIFTIDCVTTGARKMPIEYISTCFALFAAKSAQKIISSRKSVACSVLFTFKVFLIIFPLLFKKWVE